MQPELLLKLVLGDIIYGYGIPLPLHKLTQIPDVCMAPPNIQAQWTINKLSKIITKDWLTHAQSWKWDCLGTSENSQVDNTQLQPCKFGKCLMRLINWTVAARLKYPGCRIFAKKDNFKSTYCQCHLNWETATKTVTQFPSLELFFMNLRLTFGGKPCPYKWCVISNVICNLTTAILHNNAWDPSCLHEQNQHLVPLPIVLDKSIPLGIGRELIVDIPANPRGMNDIYIDNLISLTVEIEGTNSLVRCNRAPLLAIATCAQPLHQHKPIPWDVIEARNKLASEAPLKERKTILFWLIDFRQLLIILPENKYKAWTTAIKTMLSEGTTTAKELEMNIGRLVHLWDGNPVCSSLHKSSLQPA